MLLLFVVVVVVVAAAALLNSLTEMVLICYPRDLHNVYLDIANSTIRGLIAPYSQFCIRNEANNIQS